MLLFDSTELGVPQFLMFVQVTRFQHIETQMIHDSLYQHATEPTTITREEYYEWIHDLVSMDGGATEEEKQQRATFFKSFISYPVN